MKRDRRALLESEASLVEVMMRDAHIRRALERGMDLPSGPMSVWRDSDHSWPLTEIVPERLPEWETLTESMKMFIGFDVGMELGNAFAFTAVIQDDFAAKWRNSAKGIGGNVEQRIRRALDKAGLPSIPFCYVIEARTRSTRSQTRPHLHGFVIADTRVDATRFKVALERALYPDLIKRGRSRPVDVEPAYDHIEELIGRPRWIRYITKNIDRWDATLRKRRVFISRSLTDLAKLAWQTRRGR